MLLIGIIYLMIDAYNYLLLLQMHNINEVIHLSIHCSKVFLSIS